MEKSTHELKAKFVYLIFWERKTNSFEFTVIILKIFKKCKSLIQKNFKSAELLTEAAFFLYFTDRPKNGEGNK